MLPPSCQQATWNINGSIHLGLLEVRLSLGITTTTKKKTNKQTPNKQKHKNVWYKTRLVLRGLSVKLNVCIRK